jgi:hypothetical protein
MSTTNVTTAEVRACLKRMKKIIRACEPAETASEKLKVLSRAITRMGTENRLVEQMSTAELADALHAFDTHLDDGAMDRMPVAELQALVSERNRLIGALAWVVGSRVGFAGALESYL